MTGKETDTDAGDLPSAVRRFAASGVIVEGGGLDVEGDLMPEEQQIVAGACRLG